MYEIAEFPDLCIPVEIHTSRQVKMHTSTNLDALSSKQPLATKKSNGICNFQTAIEKIMDNKSSSV